MELWIRSQDKEKLVKCNDIAIATDTEDGKTIRGYKIVGYFDKQTEYEELGFYTLYSRALEVLDEIQRQINTRPLIIPAHNHGDTLNNYYDYISNNVYEMPKEWWIYECNRII